MARLIETEPMASNVIGRNGSLDAFEAACWRTCAMRQTTARWSITACMGDCPVSSVIRAAAPPRRCRSLFLGEADLPFFRLQQVALAS